MVSPQKRASSHYRVVAMSKNPSHLLEVVDKLLLTQAGSTWPADTRVCIRADTLAALARIVEGVTDLP